MMEHNGEPIFSEKQWGMLEAKLELPARQRQVVRLLFEGCSDKQMADVIGVALPTVRSHLRRLYGKFHVQDRTELVLYIVHEIIHLDGIDSDVITKNDI